MLLDLRKNDDFLNKIILILKNKLFAYFMAFIIPVFVVLLIMYLLHVYPFGKSSYLLWDSDLQFVPFLGYFKSLFSSNIDFIYSLFKEGGNGMYEFNTCYIMNPLNLIAFLFPPDKLDIAFETITIIKIGLCGLGFAYFLNHGKKFEYLTLMFSSAYALSTAALYFSQSIMGFEGMYLLPFALAGTEKIIKYAKILSKDIDFVRVDFMEIDNNIFFAEMTFTPYSGFFKFTPEKFDLIYGKKLILHDIE